MSNSHNNPMQDELCPAKITNTKQGVINMLAEYTKAALSVITHFVENHWNGINDDELTLELFDEYYDSIIYPVSF